MTNLNKVTRITFAFSFITHLFSMQELILDKKFAQNYSLIQQNIKEPLSPKMAYKLIKQIIISTPDEPQNKKKLNGLLNKIYVNLGEQEIELLHSDKKIIKEAALLKGITIINNERLKESASTTDLQLALLNNHTTLFHLLFKHTDKKTRKELGWKLLHCAVVHANIQLLEYMLKNNVSSLVRSPITGDTLWHVAALLPEMGLKILAYLTDYYEKTYNTKFKWTLVNNEAKTPLHVVCSYHCRNIGTSTLKYILRKYTKNINDLDEFGNAPVHLACLWDCHDHVEELIKYNCNINITNNRGQTALHLVCEYLNRESAKTLIHDKNINIELKDLDGQTALATLLRPKKRTLEDWHKTIFLLTLLLKHSANPSPTDNYKDTPLHYLIAINPDNISEQELILKAVYLLLKHNASLDSVNRDNVDPLTFCTFKLKKFEKKNSEKKATYFRFIQSLLLLDHNRRLFSSQPLDKLLTY